jgi:chaperonin cofactor prefoldin
MNSDDLPTRASSEQPELPEQDAVDLSAEAVLLEAPIANPTNAAAETSAAAPLPGEPPDEEALPASTVPAGLDAAYDVPLPPLTMPSAAQEAIDRQPGALRQEAAELTRRVAELRQQEQALKQEIANLQTSYTTMLRQQMAESQMVLGRLVKEGLSELEQRKQTLQIAVEQLERRQDRIRTEMRSTFAGASQDLAIRVQGFKDYLVGSLQDLAAAAEQLELASPATARKPAPVPERPDPEPAQPQFAEQGFQEQVRQIRRLLDQYRTSPDYYGAPWQLRRTFEPVHAERVANWFFSQGGRGAVRTMGSRLQNILIVSAAISILRKLYGERVRTLVLANSPERLGEWRRGLQDCLGITRADFGSEQGVVLFEAPEPLAQRADRLVKRGLLPLIIIDEAEDQINLSLLQFPLWLAIAADPMLPTVI